MKKIAVMVVVMMLLLPLAACTRESVDASTAAQDITSLLIGTLRLEETDLAVSPEMGSQLLPLWQAARTIYLSDASAAEEQEAILNQIREVMTAEQIAAIEGMDLASEDMGQAMHEMLSAAFPEGFEFGEGFEGFIISGEAAEGMQEGFVVSEQGAPGGNPEGGAGVHSAGTIVVAGPSFAQGLGPGPGEGFGQELSPEAMATLQAERGGRPAIFVNPIMFEIIIDFLEARSQEG